MSAPDVVVFHDQELLDLEQKYLDVLRRRTALPLYQGPEWEALDEELWRLITLIGDTPPKTSIGATVKLRLLLNEDRGISADPGENDIKSLQQVFELVQRQGVERRLIENALAKYCAKKQHEAPQQGALNALDVSALVAERMKIWHSNDGDASNPAISDDEKERRSGIVCDQVNELDNRIADMVAPSADGILAQVELLTEWVEFGDWVANRDVRLMETIKAGLRNLLSADDEGGSGAANKVRRTRQSG